MGSQHLELKADFPSVLQCDLILCDVVKQLEEKEETRGPSVTTLGDAAIIPTRAARQTCLTETAVFFRMEMLPPLISVYKKVPAGLEEQQTPDTRLILVLLTIHVFSVAVR